MDLVIALISAVIFAVLFREPMRRHPIVFYALAISVDIAFLTRAISSLSAVAGRMLFAYMQQGLFAFGLLSVVMFIGVLPEKSRAKRYLRPVRGELSVVACIFIVGHVLNYLQPVFMRVVGGADVRASVFTGVLISVILVALLTILTVTSFRSVRDAMPATSWRRIQLFAYPFYFLMFCHVMAMLLPSALSGANRATIAVALYAILGLSYVTLRLWRLYCDRRGAAAPRCVSSVKGDAGVGA